MANLNLKYCLKIKGTIFHAYQLFSSGHCHLLSDSSTTHYTIKVFFSVLSEKVPDYFPPSCDGGLVEEWLNGRGKKKECFYEFKLVDRKKCYKTKSCWVMLGLSTEYVVFCDPKGAKEIWCLLSCEIHKYFDTWLVQIMITLLILAAVTIKRLANCHT